MSALWGELAASVANEAASRGVTLDLQVDDLKLAQDPEAALRIYRNLTLTALRLTVRDACLRIRVCASEEGYELRMESVCSGARQGPRLYRAARSVPSEAGFALHAARAFVGPLGGSIESSFLPDLGVRFTLRIPQAPRSFVDCPRDAQA